MIILFKPINILINLSVKTIQWMALLTFLLSTSSLLAKTYMSQSEFLALVNQHLSTEQILNPEFKNKTIWLKKEIQSHIKSILDHQYAKLRIRYKFIFNQNSPITIWFLNETGKERPISFGISVMNNRVQIIRVLEFRESRGHEINIPAFAEQFEQAGLDEHGKLDLNIDGITGATMSVSAMKKMAQLAIYLHQLAIIEFETKNKK